MAKGIADNETQARTGESFARSGSSRVAVPASVRMARRGKTLASLTAGCAVVAAATVGLVQPFFAAPAASVAAEAPSLADITQTQSQNYQADLGAAVRGDAPQQTTPSVRGGDVTVELEPEPTPTPEPAAPSSNSEDTSQGTDSVESAPVVSYDPGTVQGQAQQLLYSLGYSEAEWGCFDYIISAESGWNPAAQNPSGAYGLPQALPGEKMSSAGADWATNPMTQVRWAIGYMQGRYGSICGAYNTWITQHWY